MQRFTASLLRVAAVAHLTFLEARRSRLGYGLIAVALALFAGSWLLGAMSFHEEVRLSQDLGLMLVSLVGITFTVVFTINLLHKELERKTVLIVLTKPLSRGEFIVGKYLGVVGTLLLLWAIMVTLLLAMIASRAAGTEQYWSPWNLGQAAVLVLFEWWLLAAVAMVMSALSSPYLAGVLTVGLWMIGRSTPELFALSRTVFAESLAGELFAAMASVVPDFHVFFVSGHMVSGVPVSIHEIFVGWYYVAQTAGYVAVYAALCLWAASAIFRRRDFT